MKGEILGQKRVSCGFESYVPRSRKFTPAKRCSNSSRQARTFDAFPLGGILLLSEAGLKRLPEKRCGTLWRTAFRYRRPWRLPLIDR